MSNRDRPARLAAVTPADPADDWRLLASGASGDDGDRVPVRLEIRGDRAALRYSVQIAGTWHRREQMLDAAFARFIDAVRGATDTAGVGAG